MGLFEIFIERYNRGPRGTLGSRHDEPERGAVGLRFAIAVVLLVLWIIALVDWTDTTGTLVVASLASVAYLVVAFFLRPEPNYSNVGWLGGLIDHPLRFSDDLNRSLIFLLVVFWPGRLVSTALVDGLRRLRMG